MQTEKTQTPCPKKGRVPLPFCLFCLLLVPIGLWAAKKLTGNRLDVTLSGFTESYELPALTGQGLADGSFQTGFDNWWQNCFAPRGVLIKSYNTLRYLIFHKAVCIVGKDDTLFEYDYISEQYGLSDCPNYTQEENQQALRDYLATLESINRKLKKLGKAMVFTTLPGKPTYYGEAIPQSFQESAPSDYLRAVDYLRRIVGEYNIPYLDCREVLEASGLQTPVFYRSGTHMSLPADHICAQAILQSAAEQLGRPLPTFTVGSFCPAKPLFGGTPIF